MPKTTRRQLLKGATALGLGGCVAPPAGAPGTPSPVDVSAPPDERDAIEPVTSAEDFYVTSSAAPPEAEWVESWSLRIEGLDGEDIVLGLDELKSFGGEEHEHTLECISNYGAVAISNGLWTGLRLDRLLEALGAAHSKSSIEFRCGEGYWTYLPAEVMDDGLWLVWALNGEPLAEAHGYPLRALVAGRYGMKNPKWIGTIRFTDEAELGFWESRGWSDSAVYQLHSWIHAPSVGDLVSQGGADILGSAFAGMAGISKVELSGDGGETWKECELTYAGGENVWTLWRCRWEPGFTGQHELVVRATDGAGRIQEDLERYDEELDGFEGLHKVAVIVG